MKLKYMIGCLAISTTLSFAAEIPAKTSINQDASAPVSSPAKVSNNKYATFQSFDNQFNLGLGMTHGTTVVNNTMKNPAYGDIYGSYNNSSSTLEIEKLFDIGVWFVVDGTFVNTYSQSANQNLVEGQQSGNNITGNNPFFGGVNAKVGYGFPFNDQIMVTPYGDIGRSTNMSSYALDNLAAGQKNITESYFNTFGLGFRIDAIAIPEYLELYIDENFDRNYSHTPIATAVFAGDPSYTSFVSTIGLKWRVAYNFQLGANYNYTYMYQNASGSGGSLLNIQDSQVNVPYYTPTGSSSYMLTAGFNY